LEDVRKYRSVEVWKCRRVEEEGKVGKWTYIHLHLKRKLRFLEKKCLVV